MLQLLDYEIDILKVLFIFYLIIFSSQIHNSFKSLNIRSFSKSIIIQYIIIFFVFFFLVSSISDTKNIVDIEPIQKLIYSIVYFIIFLITLKINNIIRFTIFILLIVCYFLNMNYKYYNDLLTNNNNNNNKYYWFTWKYPKINMFIVDLYQINILKQIIIYIIYIVYILFIIGVILYLTNLFNKNINYKNYLNYK